MIDADLSSIMMTGVLMARSDALRALTGPSKIFDLDAPEDADPPFIVQNIIAAPEARTLRGINLSQTARVSLECVGIYRDPQSAVRLGRMVGTVLSRVGRQTVILPEMGTFSVNIRKAADVTEWGDARQLPRRIVDFYVTWRPAG